MLYLGKEAKGVVTRYVAKANRTLVLYRPHSITFATKRVGIARMATL
jgi:hypothetical protein